MMICIVAFQGMKLAKVKVKYVQLRNIDKKQNLVSKKHSFSSAPLDDLNVHVQ